MIAAKAKAHLFGLRLVWLLVGVFGSWVMAGCEATDGRAPATLASTPIHDSQRFEFIAPHMGAAARIVLYADDPDRAHQAAEAAFAEIASLDAMLSDYRDNSELSLVNAQAGVAPVAISQPFSEVLTIALEVAELSGGAFDPCIGPVTLLWREARRSGKMPSDTALRIAHALVDWRRVHVDKTQLTVMLRSPGMRLDLGGIAKGYAAERALRSLQASGMSAAIVALAGDIAIGSPPPHQSGWRIAIADGLGSESPILALADCCVSTSGDAEQNIRLDGQRLSHIIRPGDGMGLRESIAVTVIAPRGAYADAIATTVSVLGRDQGLRLLESVSNVEGRIVSIARNGAVDVWQTPGFAARVNVR